MKKDTKITQDLFGYEYDICDMCDGTGEYPKAEYTCDECDGTGEITVWTYLKN